ncbi:MAG: hypothetical protein HY744_14010 [Deltaproteobacteria bacterium]|nr:hypothetical protein [Deltaproteobacteria bacterium]
MATLACWAGRSPVLLLVALAGACGESFTTGQGAGGTAATATATGAAGQGGSPGQGGQGDGEKCLNGQDDDGDSLADCADPQCATGYGCASAAPAGWEGLLRAQAVAFGQGPPLVCPGGAPAERVYFGAEQPMSCAACKCGTLQGVSCSPPKIGCWKGSGECEGAAKDQTGSFTSAACVGFEPLGPVSSSCRITEAASVASPGSCAPSGGEPGPAAPFSGQLEICWSPAGAGCPAGKACVAAAPAGLDALGVCIRREGHQECPEGWSTAFAGFGAYGDNRDCAPCGCQPPAVACQGGAYTIYPCNKECQEPLEGSCAQVVTVSGGDCKNTSTLMGPVPWSVKATGPGAVGADQPCAPTGGQPTGAVTHDAPTTICCRP